MQSIGEISKQPRVPAVRTPGQPLMHDVNKDKISHRKDVARVQLKIHLFLICKLRSTEQLHTPAFLNLRNTTCMLHSAVYCRCIGSLPSEVPTIQFICISWEGSQLPVAACQPVNTGQNLVQVQSCLEFSVKGNCGSENWTTGVVLGEQVILCYCYCSWDKSARLLHVTVTFLGISRPYYFMLQLLFLGLVC